MKKWFLLLSLLCSWAQASDCPLSFAGTDTCAELVWVDGPHLNRDSHFRVNFWRQSEGDRVYSTPSFDLNIYTWMVMSNGHSHGGAKLTWQAIGEGQYEVKNAKFFMGGMQGHWQIKIDLKQAGRVLSQAHTNVEFPL